MIEKKKKASDYQGLELGGGSDYKGTRREFGEMMELFYILTVARVT